MAITIISEERVEESPLLHRVMWRLSDRTEQMIRFSNLQTPFELERDITLAKGEMLREANSVERDGDTIAHETDDPWRSYGPWRSLPQEERSRISPEPSRRIRQSCTTQQWVEGMPQAIDERPPYRTTSTLGDGVWYSANTEVPPGPENQLQRIILKKEKITRMRIHSNLKEERAQGGCDYLVTESLLLSDPRTPEPFTISEDVFRALVDEGIWKDDSND